MYLYRGVPQELRYCNTPKTLSKSSLKNKGGFRPRLFLRLLKMMMCIFFSFRWFSRVTCWLCWPCVIWLIFFCDVSFVLLYLCCFFVGRKRHLCKCNLSTSKPQKKKRLVDFGSLDSITSKKCTIAQGSMAKSEAVSAGASWSILKNRLDADGPWIAWMGLKMSKTCATPLSGYSLMDLLIRCIVSNLWLYISAWQCRFQKLMYLQLFTHIM